jgi:hypothetical protein
MILNFDASPADDQITVTFDGAGSYSGTEIKNTNGVSCRIERS